jgi:hypothetical protein
MSTAPTVPKTLGLPLEPLMSPIATTTPPLSNWDTPSNPFSTWAEYAQDRLGTTGTDIYTASWSIGLFLVMQTLAHHMCLRIHTATQTHPTRISRVPRRR